MKKQCKKIISDVCGCQHRINSNLGYLCLEINREAFDCPDLPHGEFPADCPLKTVEE